MSVRNQEIKSNIYSESIVNLNDWVPARVAPIMKSEETTGDEEEDEEDDDTSDFHLDHRFLGTTDTIWKQG